ncbi:hypothetical protein QG37_00062 [Candidozyma auris]|uniref:Uncharacterized protein n=1 Tax=Candidozyma auris TaxID=498019 RepID=A0A0L0P8Z6_CANAR|nr:hypothetical protein QG37_00062 [[Candida] auris]
MVLQNEYLWRDIHTADLRQTLYWANVIISRTAPCFETRKIRPKKGDTADSNSPLMAALAEVTNEALLLVQVDANCH